MVRRIFIVWAHPLFHEALRALLMHPEVQVVGTASLDTVTQDSIYLLEPDTILLEETQEAPTANLDIARLLEASTTARVIRLSMEDNRLWVYHREQKLMQQAKDLLQLIQQD